ncbi:unnamed protein product, partial [Owenia fusiformis]
CPGQVNCSDKHECMIVEMAPKLLESEGLMLAKALVDPRNPYVPLKVANLSNEPQTLYVNMLVGLGEMLESRFVSQVDVGSLYNGEEEDVRDSFNLLASTEDEVRDSLN